VEVTTVHYRGDHAAAVKRAGFSRYRGTTARTGKRGRRSIHMSPRRCCDGLARPHHGRRQTRIH
jgi:hypothetical protein